MRTCGLGGLSIRALVLSLLLTVCHAGLTHVSRRTNAGYHIRWREGSLFDVLEVVVGLTNRQQRFDSME